MRRGRRQLRKREKAVSGELEPKNRVEILACVSRTVTIHHGLRTVVRDEQQARSKFAGDRDQMRRDLQVRFGQLASRVVAGVRWLRLREVGQLARRERRGDRRHSEQDEAQGERPGKTGAMGGANHDVGVVNKNPAIVRARFIFVGIAGLQAQIR